METESKIITKEEVIILCYIAGIPLALDRKFEQPCVHTTFNALDRLCNFVRLQTINEIKDLMNDNP